jgi:hypothetical protein
VGQPPASPGVGLARTAARAPEAHKLGHHIFGNKSARRRGGRGNSVVTHKVQSRKQPPFGTSHVLVTYFERYPTRSGRPSGYQSQHASPRLSLRSGLLEPPSARLLLSRRDAAN